MLESVKTKGTVPSGGKVYAARAMACLIQATLLSVLAIGQQSSCTGEISVESAKSNLDRFNLPLTSEQDQLCAEESIRVLGQRATPELIPILLKFLEFQVKDKNPDPPGFTLHPRARGQDYPAIYVLGRIGEDSFPILVNEISRTDSTLVRRQNALLALQLNNWKTPENVIKLLAVARNKLPPPRQLLVDDAIKSVISSAVCAPILDRCRAAAE